MMDMPPHRIPIEPNRVRIKGFGYLSLYIHKSRKLRYTKSVSDKLTGMAVGHGRNDVQAIEQAAKNLQGKTRKEIEQTQAEWLKQYPV